MKKIVFLVSIILYAVAVFAHTQPKEVDFRNLGSFTTASFSGSFTIMLVQGSGHSIRLESSSAPLDEIVTEVVGGQLKVYPRKNNWKYSSGAVRMEVTFAALEKLNLSGAHQVSSLGRIRSNAFRVNTSGSGKASLEVDTNELEVISSGSCNLELSGRGDHNKLTLSGSGSVKAFDMQSSTAKITISGSSNVEISASDNISAVISGSGNIHFKGNPTYKDVKISGSGRIKQAG
jgi:hypothetical protein